MKTRKTKKEKFFETTKADGNLHLCTTTINYSGYGYGRQYAGMTNVYGIRENGEKFDFICTFHRSNVAKKRIINGTWFDIPEAIRDNYTTNGYNTRCGLERAKNKLERIERIHKSHSEFGYLTGKDGHETRVRKRN